MTAKELQRELERMLGNHFDADAVGIEWSISKGATDVLEPADERYAPCVDVAVYTVGTTPGNHFIDISNFWEGKAPAQLKDRFTGKSPNENPRCALAIEVTFSGSPKLILGDIANASMMGLYGVVVPNEKMIPCVTRVLAYVEKLKELGKAPKCLFENVCIIPQAEFIELIS